MLLADGGSERAAAGHLEVAIGIGGADPIPGVAEPVAAVGVVLVSEPADFVVAPNPDAAQAGSAGLLAGAPVVDFDQVRELVAGPAAGGDAAFAAAINAVGESDFQDGMLRLVGEFHDAERKGMEIHEEPAVADEAAAGDVRIEQDQVASGVAGGMGTDEVEHLGVVIEVTVVVVHQLGLTEVDGFTASIDE